MTESRSEYSLIFPSASKISKPSGLIKSQTADFYVEELMRPELSGEGEHAWLWVEKDGQNTEYVAGQIARFAQVKKMDVGLSGLKDRWAVTRQWFSVYLGNKPEPIWSEFECEGVTILKHQRHNKKLRRGEHQANSFKLMIRDVTSMDNVEDLLEALKRHGFPNYYGPQRFGFNGANLDRGAKFFEGSIKASKSQRSFYLSAARSYLFNLNLARHIERGDWHSNTQGGPLYGDEVPGTNELSEEERQILDSHPAFKAGIHKNRLKLERRPYAILPKNMAWELSEASVKLEFDLPTGVFATSLLAEVFELTQGLGEGNEALRNAS